MQKENILLTNVERVLEIQLKSVTEIPDLLSVQKESFNLLVQADISSKDRDNIGLEKVFRGIFSN